MHGLVSVSSLSSFPNPLSSSSEWPSPPGPQFTRPIRRQFVSIHSIIHSFNKCSVSTWLPKWLSGKEFACQCRRHKKRRFDPRIGKRPWSRKWQLTSVFLPGNFHGQRSMVGYSPWSCKESDTTENIHNEYLL